MKNIVERPIVPYNPPESSAVFKDEYNIFAPIAANGKPGMAGFNIHDFDLCNGIVSINFETIKIVDLDKTLPSYIDKYDKDGKKTPNIIYKNYAHNINYYGDSYESPQLTQRYTYGNLLVLPEVLPDEAGQMEIFITRIGIYWRRFVNPGDIPFENIDSLCISKSTYELLQKINSIVITVDQNTRNISDTMVRTESIEKKVDELEKSSVSKDINGNVTIPGNLTVAGEIDVVNTNISMTDAPIALVNTAYLDGEAFDWTNTGFVILLNEGDENTCDAYGFIYNNFYEKPLIAKGVYDKKKGTFSPNSSDITFIPKWSGDTFNDKFVYIDDEGNLVTSGYGGSDIHRHTNDIVKNSVEITKLNNSVTRIDRLAVNHEARLDEIEEHLAPKYIITDDKTAYRKDVPANACSKAQLNSIGGMTYVDEATNTFVDAKVTELKAHGANLIPFPYKDTSKTEKGVTYTVNEDGTVVLNGTSTARHVFRIAIFSNLTAGKKCTLSGCPSGGSTNSTYAIYVSALLNGVWQNEFYDTGSSISFTPQEGVIYQVYISIWKENIQFNNLTFKPMLNYGDTALPYEPFKEAETIFQIPKAITDLPNYGKMFTELDLVNKKFIDEYAEMDGVVSWNENPVQVFEEWGGDDGVTVLGYDCSVQFMRGDLMDDGNIGLVMTEKPYDSIEYVGTQFILRKQVPQLAWWGSGEGNYALAEELFGKVTIVAKSPMMMQEDISAYIDNNIIKVTAGGSIEFVNERKNPVPSSVSFMMGGHLLEKEV